MLLASHRMRDVFETPRLLALLFHLGDHHRPGEFSKVLEKTFVCGLGVSSNGLIRYLDRHLSAPAKDCTSFTVERWTTGWLFFPS